MQYRPFARVGLYLFLVLIPSWVWAQGGDTLQRAKIPTGERETTSTQKTVEVSRAFAPTIQDADKVGRQPVMDDSASVAPHFTYQLNPHPIVTHFALRPLPAARMGAETHDPTSLFYLKLGIGNYLSPLAEGYVTSKYHEHYSGGIAAKHRSAFGSVTLANGRKPAFRSLAMRPLRIWHCMENSGIAMRSAHSTVLQIPLDFRRIHISSPELLPMRMGGVLPSTPPI